MTDRRRTSIPQNLKILKRPGQLEEAIIRRRHGQIHPEKPNAEPYDHRQRPRRHPGRQWEARPRRLLHALPTPAQKTADLRKRCRLYESDAGELVVGGGGGRGGGGGGGDWRRPR